jgi:hypothetical protein
VQRGTGPAVRLPNGCAFLPVVSAVPRFRAVQQRVTDVRTDQLVSREIRERLPDVVHVLAYGGISGVGPVWLADRLGARAVVDVAAEDLLCHRGTLVDERGQSCAAWRDPLRCLQCCTAPFEGGLTRGEARRARWLRVLGAWSPFPRAVHFRNRLDALLAGLQPAALVLVEDYRQRDLLAQAGLAVGKLRIQPRPYRLPAIAEAYHEVAQRRTTEPTLSP